MDKKTKEKMIDEILDYPYWDGIKDKKYWMKQTKSEIKEIYYQMLEDIEERRSEKWAEEFRESDEWAEFSEESK